MAPEKPFETVTEIKEHFYLAIADVIKTAHEDTGGNSLRWTIADRLAYLFRKDFDRDRFMKAAGED
jgi:hypothetical protein